MSLSDVSSQGEEEDGPPVGLLRWIPWLAARKNEKEEAILKSLQAIWKEDEFEENCFS